MSLKEKTGVVVSTKMQKTIIIAVESRYRSKLYSKIKTRTKRYFVHDESESCQLGDKIIAISSSPKSRKKCWRLKSII
uniref:ribosomal protein S17 n=1 Tax=Haramonas pauciplastida TaxID=478668 RepID=UPI0021157647|nr:ribosomal protein S17 [Haramonas pauciplastida]UTE94972.1 ribosomal protein S17 [Haramonas pauciplastida]